MRCETSVSISSGDAPGRFVRTLTVGRSTEGKRSTPSRKKLAAPTTTSDNTIMVAKTGRRIQISASFCIIKCCVLRTERSFFGITITLNCGTQRPYYPCDFQGKTHEVVELILVKITHVESDVEL